MTWSKDDPNHSSRWSHADDVVIMGAFGGYERGWQQVSARLDWAAKGIKATDRAAENIVTVVGDNLAYTVDLEHMTRHAGDQPQPRTLRCTQAYRRETASGVDGVVAAGAWLQVLIQPHAVGPFQFGYGVRATAGSRKPPGAVSLTWIDARSQEEADQVRAISRPLAAELTKAPGFISSLGVGIANRLYTITAWESEGALKQAMHNSLHTGAIKRFFTEDFCAAVGAGIWSAGHLNPLWVRCPSCDRVTDRAQAGSCTCGQTLPESPQRW